MQNCVSNVRTAGDLWTFNVSGCRSASIYNATLYISRAGQPLLNVAGVAQPDNSHTFTFTALQTAGIAEGDADYMVRYSEIATPTNIYGGEQGTIFVLPNLAVAQALTFAETMVDTLKQAVEALAGTTDLSVSFNGHSFTSAGLDQYRKDLVYWQSRVIAEQKKRDAARGKPNDGRIGFEFAPQGGGFMCAPQNPFNSCL